MIAMGVRAGDRGQLAAVQRRDDRLDIAKRERLHIVLQPTERVEVRRRDEIRPRGDQLPELHKCRPQPFQIAGQLLGLRWRRWRGGKVERLQRSLEQAPHSQRAHPTTEHFLPLLVALGAADPSLEATTVLDGGIVHGVLAMESYVFGREYALHAEEAA